MLFAADGRHIPLKPKVFETLLYLVRNAGRVIEKSELMSAIWPDTIVEENNLNKNISVLRRSLGESLGDNRFIATVPGRGYQFVAKVGTVATSTRSPDDAREAEPHKSGRMFLAAGALIIVTLLVAGMLLLRNQDGGSPNAPTLAVLPFRPLVVENRDEALELGMAETLIGRLRGTGMVVRPLSSVRQFGSPGQDAVEAGRALGVASVLDGNIQHWGDMIRVNVRLLKVADGSVLWAETFDEKFTDIFRVQDSISGKVVAALPITLTSAGKSSLEKRQTNDPAAYAYYMRGRYNTFKVTEPELRRSISFFQLAIDVDPNYALAYAGMADAYRVLVIASYAPGKEACPKAKELAKRALELDDSIADAHIVLGWIGFLYDWDWRTAEKELRRAIEIDPNNSEAHRAYAHLLSNSRRHDQAIHEGRLARELAPLTLITATLEAQFLFDAGRYDEALDRASKALELDPDFWVTHNVIGRVLTMQGRYAEAIAELSQARDLSGGSTDPLMQLGYAYAASGDRANAEAQIEKLRQISGARYVPAYNLAMIYNGLGENDKAVDELEKSLGERDAPLAFIKVDRRWDPLRSNPRFADVIARMNIVE